MEINNARNILARYWTKVNKLISFVIEGDANKATNQAMAAPTKKLDSAFLCSKFMLIIIIEGIIHKLDY